ncbi:UNVERIFIED_ORG: GNAT family N-acetyltransferase [Shinella sp. XGS7]|nr:GNAT family N-acetyltransferase [Shinella sp. XGS7]
MIAIRPMTPEDYDAVLQLMADTPGVTVRDADSAEATARYLARNPGLSFVAQGSEGGRLLGCIMSGHDGRRGYLQHLVVRPELRRQGIANRLVEHCLQGLAALGIQKSHVDVFRSNELAQAFWSGQGWQRRDDIHRYSLVRGGSENA